MGYQSKALSSLIGWEYSASTGSQRLGAGDSVNHVSAPFGSFCRPGHLLLRYAGSDMTTTAYTMLAFTFISLILELLLGRIKLSSLDICDCDLVGFELVVAGYMVFVSKPQG